MSKPVIGVESMVARAVGYSLLAHCFAYPGEDRVAMLNEAAAAGEPVLASTPLASLVPSALAAAPALLQPVYSRIFSLTASPDCPTYETAYIDTEMITQAQRMSRIKAFYRLFGIQDPADGFRPDDISVELDFMGFLVRKEIYAREHLGAPRVAQAMKAQRLFLAEHLACWAPALGRRIVERAGDHAFYLRLGVALEDWIDADCARLGARPVHNVEGPNIPLAPAVSHGPEFAGTAQFISLDQLQEG